MLFSLTQLVFLLNAAGIASLCLVVAICLARCFSSLPKQHGVLATGLIVALMTPILALIIRKMNVLREMICDDIAASADLAIEYPAAAKDYANSLLRMAERVIDAQPKAISYGIHFLSLGELESRIRRILNSKPGRVELKMNRRFVAILGLLAVLSVLGLPFVLIRSQAIGSPIGPSATAIDEGESNKTEQRGKADAPLVTISGRVIDADGQPAPNAKVHAVSRFAKIDIATTTDERGVFEIPVRMDGKSKGILRISAESSDGSLLGYCRCNNRQGR